MRMFYLISAVVVTVLILVLAFAQVQSTCTWGLISTNASPVFVLLQTASLGGIVGGLLVLFWKFPKPEDETNADKDE